MKKILCFIGILVGCQFYMIQKSFTQAKIIKTDANRLKADVDFAKWPGKNETDASGTGAPESIPVPYHYRQITVGSGIACQASY